MTVYDRVIPNNAVESLVALCIGMGLLITFDFLLKFLRANFIDTAGQKIDKKIAKLIFDRIMRASSTDLLTVSTELPFASI